MGGAKFLTTKQVGDLIGKPEWLVRRVVDSIGDVQRFGHKRMIPAEMVERIRVEIEQRQAKNVNLQGAS